MPCEGIVLTPAERRLVSRLVLGKSLRTVSSELNITYETARSTLKSVFQKTGTHRQAELIVKLLSMVGNGYPAWR